MKDIGSTFYLFMFRYFILPGNSFAIFQVVLMIFTFLCVYIQNVWLLNSNINVFVYLYPYFFYLTSCA